MKKLIAFLVSTFIGISTTQAQWNNIYSTVFQASAIYNVQVVDANNVWAVAYQQKKVIKTTDGGLNWSGMKPADPTFADYFIESIAVLNPFTAWLTATTKDMPPQSRIYKTTNGGASWQRQATAFAIADSQKTSVIYFFDANHGVNLGEKDLTTTPPTTTANILITNNGGATWLEIPPASLPAGTQLNAGVFGRAYAVVNNTIWYMGKDRQIYRSVNKGQTWTTTDPGFPVPNPVPIPETMSIAFKDSLNGLAACNGILKKTTDGGLTWTTVTTSGNWFSNELVHIPGTATYFSGGNGMNSQNSTVSYDDGNTWHTLETFPTTNPHNDVHFLNATTGWSGGPGWMRQYTGKTLLGLAKEQKGIKGFQVYPNPGQGLFHVTSAATAPFTLEVYDAVGHQVMQQQSNGFGKNTLDLSGHTKGIYLLHILTGEQHLIEKIVLQ